MKKQLLLLPDNSSTGVGGFRTWTWAAIQIRPHTLQNSRLVVTEGLCKSEYLTTFLLADHNFGRRRIFLFQRQKLLRNRRSMMISVHARECPNKVVQLFKMLSQAISCENDNNTYMLEPALLLSFVQLSLRVPIAYNIIMLQSQWLWPQHCHQSSSHTQLILQILVLFFNHGLLAFYKIKLN